MINKFQEGGELNQVLTLVAQFLLQNGQAQDEQSAMQAAQQLVQAAQSGDQEATNALNTIMEATQQQTQMARLGAKLNYIKRLRGECPEGQELVYFKAGGRICKACMGMKTRKAETGMELPRRKPKVTVKSKEQAIRDSIHREDSLYKTNMPLSTSLRGKSKKEIEKIQKQNRKDAANGKEMFAKGGILANKGTAFGDGKKGANPRNTDHGGHKSHGNTNAASQLKKTNIPNKFTAFGDTGKKKPTNVGLVGHTATGQTGRIQSKQTVKDTVNKHTAFGGHINKTHKKSKACVKGGWSKISGAPRGLHPRFKIGGSLNGIPFIRKELVKVD